MPLRIINIGSSFWKKTFSFLVLCCVLLSVLYGYFISSSIINVLVRKEIERDITLVNSRISELESAYLAQKNEITLDYAHQNGFYTISEKKFAIRSSLLTSGLDVDSE